MAVFLFGLAIFIHLVLLSTQRFNWLEGSAAAVTTPTAQVLTIEPRVRSV